MKRRGIRAASAALAAAATLWVVAQTAGAESLGAAVEELKQGEQAAMYLVRYGMGGAAEAEPEDALAAMVLRQAPMIFSLRREAEAVWSSELQLPPQSDSEDAEGTVLSPPAAQQQETPQEAPEAEPVRDNGVSARTLRAAEESGYVIRGGVYINNGSSCVPGETAETWNGGDAPARVLILHTHATESYTMPQGEEYEATDPCRTTDEAYNMVRIGEEMARVLESYGIEVIHDTTAHDYPRYSGAYTRSLETAEAYLAEDAQLCYILDVHRDAVTDAQGNEYKLVSAEDPGAAQIEFVVGTPGGGAAHPQWEQNLALAAAVQRTIQRGHPTLMRPIALRNARYNQHLTPGTLLVEIGTAGNSLAEAINAARLFAAGFAETILA